MRARFVRQFAHVRRVGRHRANREIELGKGEAKGHLRPVGACLQTTTGLLAMAETCRRQAGSYIIFCASVLPRSAGDFTVLTPAFSSAVNLAAAVPLPPEMIAPACPMRLPGGAEAPA